MKRKLLFLLSMLYFVMLSFNIPDIVKAEQEVETDSFDALLQRYNITICDKTFEMYYGSYQNLLAGRMMLLSEATYYERTVTLTAHELFELSLKNLCTPEQQKEQLEYYSGKQVVIDYNIENDMVSITTEDSATKASKDTFQKFTEAD